ncbi:MAG: protein kinase [Alphaproteobacteria bacterium]|nr:protein kinase [Alphaproteobacteria bacterium]
MAPMGGPSDTWSDDNEPSDTADSTVDLGGPTERAKPTTDAPRYGPPRLLGEGGIGAVFAMHDSRLGREVARKELKPGASHRTLRRFLREARVTAQLEHPGIVPVHDAGVDADGRHYYTMKYVRGRSLGDALADAHGLADRLRWVDSLVDAVQAMAYAHSRGVIHRDLKPDNLMVGEFGESLVVDWGLARALDDLDDRDPTDESPPDRPLDLGDSAQTVQGGISGTPSYMAPEQAKGEILSPASDVFGLGAILYEMLTGAPPYGRGAAIEILRRAAKGVWRPVRDVQPDAPPELAAIAEKALQPDVAARYATAGEMAADLVAWQQGRRVGAHTYTSRELLQRFAAAYRAPLAVLALGLVVTAGTGSAGWYTTAQQRDAAVQARADAERALATSYQARASTAQDEGFGLEAMLLAAAALETREDPDSRGVLARFRQTPQLAFEATIETACTRLVEAGEDFVCSGDGWITRLDREGAVQWKVEHEGRVLEAGSGLVLVSDVDRSLLAALSDGDGRELWQIAGAPTGGLGPDGSVWAAGRERLVIRGASETVEQAGPGSLMTRFRVHDGAMYGLTVSGNLYRFDPSGARTTVRSARQQSFDFDFVGALSVVVGETVEALDADGHVVATLPSTQTSFSVAPRGERVAVLDVGGGLALWAPAEGILHARSRTHAGPGSAVFTSDDTLWVGDVDGLRRWRVEPGMPDVIDIGVRSKQLALSPDGTRAVACGQHGFLAVLALEPFDVLWLEASDRGTDTDLCGWVDGTRIYAGPERETPGVRDAATGAPVGHLQPGVRGGVALTAEGGWVLRPPADAAHWVLENSVDGRRRDLPEVSFVTEDSGRVWLQDPEGLREVRLPEGDLGPVVHRMGADERFLAVSDVGYVARHGQLAEYRSGAGDVRCALGSVTGPPTFAGDRLLLPRADGVISVVGLEDGCPTVAELRGHTRRIGKLHVVGRTLYSHGWDGEIRRWDLGALDADPATLRAELEARTGLGLVDGEVVRVRE